MLRLLSKYNIKGVFAVIPHNFLELGAYQIKLLKKYDTYVTLHGIHYINCSKTEGTKTKFPDDCDIDAQCKKLREYQKNFQEVFGDKLLPVFVPPYNSISEKLEQELLKDTFLLVSKDNRQNHHKDNMAFEYNIDIDFMHWEPFHLKSEEEILTEIMNRISDGQKLIGFNSHFKCMNSKWMKILDKLLFTLSKFDNVKFVMPLPLTKQK